MESSIIDLIGSGSSSSSSSSSSVTPSPSGKFLNSAELWVELFNILLQTPRQERVWNMEGLVPENRQSLLDRMKSSKQTEKLSENLKKAQFDKICRKAYELVELSMADKLFGIDFGTFSIPRGRYQNEQQDELCSTMLKTIIEIGKDELREPQERGPKDVTKKQVTDGKAEKVKARTDAFEIGGSHVQKSQGLGARVNSGDENEEEENDLENPVPHNLQAMTAAHAAAAKGGPGGKPLKKDKSRASNKKSNVPIPKISRKGAKVDKKKKHSGKKRKKSDDNDDPSEASDGEDEDESTSSDESQDLKVMMKEATKQIRDNQVLKPPFTPRDVGEEFEIKYNLLKDQWAKGRMTDAKYRELLDKLFESIVSA